MFTKSVGLISGVFLIVSFLHFLKVGGFIVSPSKTEFKIRSHSDLPSVDLGWLELKDHFMATVGDQAGQGQTLHHLVVLADAKIKSKSFFPKHPHRDMEILTYVVKGTLSHVDDKGTSQELPSGNLQLMSARDGIFHAEGNSSGEILRILQIWIQPKTNGGVPIVLSTGLKNQGFHLLAGPARAPLLIRQDLWFYAARLSDETFEFVIPEGQFAYVVSIGALTWNGNTFEDGDGALVETGKLEISGTGQAIIILQNNQRAKKAL
jgi:redox-sensitive bicupin YhaK (pirin superfamily)